MDNGAPDDPMFGFGETTHWGLSTRLSVGKEWWISRTWALGLGAEFLAGRMRAARVIDEIQVCWMKAASLLVTASFN